MRWRWNAGAAMRRCRMWKAPSLVMRPSPSRIFMRRCVRSLIISCGWLIEHLADEIGVVDEDDVLPAQLVVCDAAVGGSEVLEEKDGVGWLEEAAAQIEEEVERQPGRIAIPATLDDGPLLRGAADPASGVCSLLPCVHIRMRGAESGALPLWTGYGDAPLRRRHRLR